jgi:hypothetical protein
VTEKPDVKKPVERPTVAPDGRTIIYLPSVRIDAVDAVVKRISQLEIFQVDGLLTYIKRGPKLGEGGFIVNEGEPIVLELEEETLLERSQTVCKFMMRKRSEFGGNEYREVDPPITLIRTLMARHEWSHIRPLDCLVSWPLLRPDGTVFDGVGYDLATRCYATEQMKLDLPRRVTKAQVAGALAVLDDLLRDFPFEKPEHKSAWLAALLSVIARPAIDGPIPMLVVDANDRGAGKTLLCELIGMVLSGKSLPRRTAPSNHDEWGKTMLGIGVGGYPMVLFDNVKGVLESRVLEAILTGNEFKHRHLGHNQDLSVCVRSQFLVSSNNATLSPDLVRRSLHCRLLVDQERPERRGGFKYRLPEDAAKPEFRKSLLESAIKILLGYEHAGRPKVSARPVGSYESWAARVQAPILWAGLADPVSTQDELREQADPEHEQLEILLDAWYDFFGEESLTVAHAMTRVREGSSGQNPNMKAMQLQSALETLSEIPGHPITAARVGVKLRGWREKWVNGKSFSWGTLAGGARRWCVRLKRDRA